ncbi:MAG: hypothetical protein HY718_16175, partial [Planctomycetes bacterium]|nr:hypothetical protein [Planctomycetota bacterium]
AEGRVREGFERYVASFRPLTDRVHFNYNSWWTSPVPFGEADILGLIRTFDEKLHRPHGVSFDTFTIDLGWSDPQGIWKISDRLFPNGFAPLSAALAGQGSRLGLWWSPSNCYSPLAFDNAWAATQGYEITSVPRPDRPPAQFACLALDNKYQRDTKAALCGIARDAGLGQLKFDGYLHECNEKTHHHLPGELSREPIAAGMLDVFESLRRASPDLWMETTCFGFDASPWWLRYVNSVIGPFGDDAPYGAVPAPVYRDSYTTSRDFYNLHGSVTPVPIAAQEVLGIIHQSPEPLYDDAVTTVLRGHGFISLYLHPRFMSDEDYAFLAALMTWTRANAPLLARTKTIWPAEWRKNGPAPVKNLRSMPRQTYAYARWRDGEGILCVRNPWIAMDWFDIVLDEATIGMDADAKGEYAAVQVYPYPACLADGLRRGDPLKLRLGPYETKVVRLVRQIAGLEPTPDPLTDAERTVRVGRFAANLVEVTVKSPETQPLGDDYTVRSPARRLIWRSRAEGEADVAGWRLCLLVESFPKTAARDPPRVVINDRPATASVVSSESGWSAAQPPGRQNTWTWFMVDVPQGPFRAMAEVEVRDEGTTVSAWLMRTLDAPGPVDPAVQAAVGTPGLPLPPRYHPKVSKPLLALVKAESMGRQSRTEGALVEQIDGVYTSDHADWADVWLERAADEQGAHRE